MIIHSPVSDLDLSLMGAFFLIFLYLFALFIERKLDGFMEIMDRLDSGSTKEESKSKLK